MSLELHLHVVAVVVGVDVRGDEHGGLRAEGLVEGFGVDVVGHGVGRARDDGHCRLVVGRVQVSVDGVAPSDVARVFVDDLERYFIDGVVGAPDVDDAVGGGHGRGEGLHLIVGCGEVLVDRDGVGAFVAGRYADDHVFADAFEVAGVGVRAVVGAVVVAQRDVHHRGFALTLGVAVDFFCGEEDVGAFGGAAAGGDVSARGGAAVVGACVVEVGLDLIAAEAVEERHLREGLAEAAGHAAEHVRAVGVVGVVGGVAGDARGGVVGADGARVARDDEQTRGAGGAVGVQEVGVVDVEAAVHEADDDARAVIGFSAHFGAAFVDGRHARIGLGLIEKLAGLGAEGDVLDLAECGGGLHLGHAHSHDGHVVAGGQDFVAAFFEDGGVFARGEGHDYRDFVVRADGRREGYMVLAGAAEGFRLHGTVDQHRCREVKLTLCRGPECGRGGKAEEYYFFHIDCVGSKCGNQKGSKTMP